MKFKNIFIILIIIFLLPTIFSCKNDEKDLNNDIANVTYVQKIYEKSSLYTSMFDEHNGFDRVTKISYSNKDENYYVSFFNSSKNKEWIDIYNKNFEFVKSITGDISELDQNVVKLSAFGTDIDNNIYMLKVQKDSSGSIIAAGRAIIVFDNSGNLMKEIIVDDAVDIWDSWIIDDLIVTENNFIIVSSVGLQIIDKKGKTLTEITGANKEPYYVSSAAADNNNSLYYISNGSLKKIDLITLNELWSVSDHKGRGMSNVALSSENINKLCVKNGNELSVYDNGGNYLGDMCNLYDFKLSFNEDKKSTYASVAINSLVYIDDNTLLFSFTSISNSYDSSIPGNEFSEIVKLQAVSEAEQEKRLTELENQKKNQKTINCLLPTRDTTFENIISDYKKDNVNINIEVEYYTENPNLFNASDYIQYVSTCLNAGDIKWDIISSEYIPYKTYAAKDLFVNLDTIDKNSILKDNSKFFTNIIDAFREKNGNLFVFPNSIKIYLIESLTQPLDAEIKSIEQLYKEALKLKENALYPFSANVSIELICGSLFSEFCNTDYGDVSFDKTSFYAVLDIIKKYSDPELYSPTMDNAALNIKFLHYLPPEGYEPKESIDLMPSSINADKEKYTFQSSGFMIFSKSEAKNESFNFLSYLAEYENNKLNISRKEFNNKLDQLEAYVKYRISSLNSEQLDEYETKTKRFREELLSIFEKLNNNVIYNYDFIKIFYEQLPRYLENSITKEDFAQKIEDYIWLLENENK